MPSNGVFDYLTKDSFCIECNRQNNGRPRRLPLYLAALDMLQITSDCTEIEKKLIISSVKRTKNAIRGGDPDERK